MVTDPAVRQRATATNVSAPRNPWHNVTIPSTSVDEKIDRNTVNILPLPLTGESSPFFVRLALCLRCKIVSTLKNDTILPTPISPHYVPGLPFSKITFLKKDRLDESIATLDIFSLPIKKLLLYSWNIETFNEQFQSIVKSLPLGFYCLRKIKSQNSDILQYPFLYYYLSGAPSDPHAGIGFAIPTPLLPIMHDFHPWDSRLAILILNTRPYKTALFTIYTPSQLSDLTQD